DGSFDPGRLALGAEGDVAAEFDLGGVVDEEGAEDGGFGGVLVGLVVHRDRLHRGAEGVGEQHELLALVVGDVPDPGQEIDRVVPLLLGETDVADEVVQVYSQRLHDLLESRVIGVVEGCDDPVDEVLFDLTLRIREGGGGVGGGGHGGFLLVGLGERVEWAAAVAGSATVAGSSPLSAAVSNVVRFSAVISRGLFAGSFSRTISTACGTFLAVK